MLNLPKPHDVGLHHAPDLHCTTWQFGHIPNSRELRSKFTDVVDLCLLLAIHRGGSDPPPPLFRTFVVEKHYLLYQLAIKLIVLNMMNNMHILVHTNRLLLFPLHRIEATDVCLGKYFKLDSLAITICDTILIQIVG
jgi:hypothetical protein